MIIETYEEQDQRPCPLCDEPVLRGHEVIVMCGDTVVHDDCHNASTAEGQGLTNSAA